MQKRLPKLMGATTLALLMLSFLVAIPASAADAPSSSVPTQPIWVTLNSLPQGNYPGGNEIFNVFVVNSDQPPAGNITLWNETLTAPALPANYQTNTAIGIPIQLSPGQAILNTIALEIPSNFTQANFTANLVAYVYYTATPNDLIKLTTSTVVFMQGLPGSGTQTTTSSTSQTSQSTQTTTQSGTVSTTTFAAAVAIPTIVVLLLLILLVRRSGRPK